MTRCPFSLSRLVKVTDTGQVVWQAIARSAVKGEAEEVEQIFNAFYSKGRQRGGFGVGLTIVKRLTERFGWTVKFDSEPGKGTRVTVEFPGSRYELAAWVPLVLAILAIGIFPKGAQFDHLVCFTFVNEKKTVC